jgi:DNA uptake protein ComE-like DNA-binding protein
MLKLRLSSALLVAIGCCLLTSAQTQAQSESYAERAAHSSSTTARHAAPLDINHATVDELMTIPGITQVWAKRIIRYRPYRTKQDLLDHGIVPVGVYNQIHDLVIAHRNSQ